MQPPIERLLPRLKQCKQTGNSRWTAQCPAHDDHSPSLSIQATADQTVLIKCWAGCTADEIVTALGLTLRDLFPNRHTSLRCYPSSAALEHERVIVQIGRIALARGGMTDADRARYETALQRLVILGETTGE